MLIIVIILLLIIIYLLINKYKDELKNKDSLINNNKINLNKYLDEINEKNNILLYYENIINATNNIELKNKDSLINKYENEINNYKKNININLNKYLDEINEKNNILLYYENIINEISSINATNNIELKNKDSLINKYENEINNYKIIIFIAKKMYNTSFDGREMDGHSDSAREVNRKLSVYKFLLRILVEKTNNIIIKNNYLINYDKIELNNNDEIILETRNYNNLGNVYYINNNNLYGIVQIPMIYFCYQLIINNNKLSIYYRDFRQVSICVREYDLIKY